MKRFAVLLLTLALAVCCTLPAFAADTIEVNEDVSVSGDYDWTRFKGQNVAINVYNWGEYISNGSDDSVDVVAAFEKLTGIKVNYTTFDSNESMYAKLKSGAANYDVIIPSDYMIGQMIEEDMSFADALALAQANGFAEKDPTADVEGHDACRKVCILASLAFGKHVYPSQVETEGISKITLEDVAYVASAGGVIKLLGQIKDLGGGKIAAFVGPAVVYNGSQLASVKGVFNAVLVRGDAVGDVCFYGQGAGKLPTASAVVSDMAVCAAHTEQRRIFGWGAGEEDYVVDYKTAIKMPFYVRVQGDETHIKQAFDNVKFLSRRGQPADEKAFITDEMTEEELERRLAGFPVEAVIKVASY